MKVIRKEIGPKKIIKMALEIPGRAKVRLSLKETVWSNSMILNLEWCGGAVVVQWWCGGGTVVVRWWCGGGAVVVVPVRR